MIYKVKMTQTLEFTVRGNNEDEIQEYIQTHTINEAVIDMEKYTENRWYIPYIDFEEELICPIMEDSYADLSLEKMKKNA